MKYGKIENGKLKRAGKSISLYDTINGKQIRKCYHANPSIEVLLSHGYKPIIETEILQKDGYYYTPTYTDTPNEIIQGWEEHELVEGDIE